RCRRCERGQTLNARHASGRIGVGEAGAKVCFDLSREVVVANARSQSRRDAERSFTIMEQLQSLGTIARFGKEDPVTVEDEVRAIVTLDKFPRIPPEVNRYLRKFKL